MTSTVPPISELTRIEPVYLDRLEKQGVFTTGILLEVSETPTRRQYLADHVGATINDVGTWRDEGLMLNLAGFGPDEHQLMIQAGIDGLRDILELDLDAFKRPGATRRDRARDRAARRPPHRGLVGAGQDARGGVARSVLDRTRPRSSRSPAPGVGATVGRPARMTR